MLTEQELAPQIAYHRRAAHLAEKLDHRLHLIGLALVRGDGDRLPRADRRLFRRSRLDRALIPSLFVILSAGLPAVGTAIFGIRVQGDFAGTAQRSLSTAARLEATAAESTCFAA
jgi:hypothetical protein